MTYEELIQAFGSNDQYDQSTCALLDLFEKFAEVGIVPVRFEFDETLLRGALLSIPSNEYKTWIDIGIALKNAAMKNDLKEEEAYDMWLKWSETDHSFDECVCRRKWEGMNPTGLKGIGSIFWMAKENGWSGQRRSFWSVEEMKASLEEI